MATITTLGFSIRSSYDPSGTRAATRSLITVGAVASATTTRLNTTSASMQNLAAAAISLAPALIPIGTVAAGVGAATVAMAVSSGTALGIYGAAMSGAIKRTLEMAEAGKKLDPMQKVFVGNVDRMKTSWDKFIKSTQNQTLMVANDVVAGLAVGIGRLKPVVDAVHPSIKRVSQALQDWLQGQGLQRFIDVIIKNGVPALNSLLNAGRSVLSVLGTGFRTFAPEGVKVAQALERGAAAMRQWADNGGFTRFLQTVNQYAPQVREFFRVLGDALRNIGVAMTGLGPLSLGLATALLRIVAALPPSWIQAIVVGFVAFRAVMLSMMIIQGVVTVVMALRTAFLALRGAWMILSLAFSATPLGALVLAIAALVAGIVYLATQTRFFQTVWNAVWGAVKVAAEAVWNALKTAWSATVNFFTTTWNTLSAAFRAAWQAVWGAIRTAAEAVWNALKTAWQAVINFFKSIYDAWSSAMRAAWSAFWTAIRTAAQAVWNALRAAWQAFVNVVRSIYNAWSTALRAAWQAFWTAVRTVAQGIWNAIRAAWQAFITAVRNIYNTFANFFKSAWNAFWNAVKTTANTIWNSIKDLWKKFTDGVKDIATSFINWIKDKLKDCWDSIKSTASKLWREFGEIIEKAINGVIDIINKLIGAFNNITNFLKIDVKISEIGKVNFNFANGGMVPVYPYAVGGIAGVEAFARGGVLSGYSPGRDSVPAMLSPGEGILTPEAVRGLGGPGFVNSANRTFAGHRGAGRGAKSLSQWGSMQGGFYSIGGMVPVQHFAIGGLVSAALARAGGGFSITQGEYSNSVAASAGTHSGGGVIDIAAGPGDGPAKVARLRAAGFAAWLRTPAEGFAYHIHAVLMNHPDLSPQARAQVSSYLAGGNGLANGGPDTGGGLGSIFGDIMGKLGDILRNVAMGKSPIDGIDFPGSGIIKNVLGFLTGGGNPIADMIKSMAGQLLGNVTGPILDKAFDFIKFTGIPGGGMGEIAAGMGKKLMNDVIKKFLLNKAAEAPKFDPSAAGGGGGGGTAQWAGLAATALARAGIASSQLGRFLALMQAESGGNPMAINNYDSNAAMGQASRGLMQVIPSTFAAYRDPSLSNNIFDPLANMVAAARYIAARYGGQVPGSPYAMGTNNASRGWHLVGENGPEMRYFRGGERVANTRATQRELRRNGGHGGVVFEKGCFQIDARGATTEAVREMETNLLPKLRMAVTAGVGGRKG